MFLRNSWYVAAWAKDLTRCDFAADNPNVTKAIHAEVAKAFEEDRHILEEQQKVIYLFVDPENVDFTADAGSIQARRVLRRRMKLDTLFSEAV